MPSPKNSRIRHLAEAITERLIATAATFSLASLFFHDDGREEQKATSVAVAESILRMALYFSHERAWYRCGKLGRKEK